MMMTAELLRQVEQELLRTRECVWPTISEELGSMQTRLMVSKLRECDKRFKSSPLQGQFAVESQASSVQELQKLREVIHLFEEAQAFPLNEEKWIAVDTAGKTLLSKETLCKWSLERARHLHNLGELASAAEIYRQILLEAPSNSEAWIGRGHVFLDMTVPGLADVHFSQVAVPKQERIHLQQKAFASLDGQSEELDIRRRLSQSLTTKELLGRASILKSEEFLSSACTYWAACCEHENVGTRDYHVIAECLLNIAKARRKQQSCIRKSELTSALELCDAAVILDNTLKVEALVERACWLYDFRDYDGVLRELKEVPFEGVHDAIRIRLYQNSSRRVLARAFQDKCFSSFAVGQQRSTGCFFGGMIGGPSRLRKFSRIQLWLVENKDLTLVLKHALDWNKLVSFGRLCGGIPKNYQMLSTGFDQVLDFRTQNRNFIIHCLKSRYLMGINTADTLTVCVSETEVNVYPVDVSDRIIPTSAEKHEELLVCFEDVVSTAHSSKLEQQPGNSYQSGRNFSACLWGGEDIRWFILSENNTVNRPEREFTARYTGSRSSVALQEPVLAGLYIPIGARTLIARSEQVMQTSQFEIRDKLIIVVSILVMICGWLFVSQPIPYGH